MEQSPIAAGAARHPEAPPYFEVPYQNGFDNVLASEAVVGALPQRNHPQRPPFDLYMELLSGTTFVAPRALNKRTSTYRLLPSVDYPEFKPLANERLLSGPLSSLPSPNRMKWRPQAAPEQPTDFLDALTTLAISGEPQRQSGMAMHVYHANASMKQRAFANCDGDMIILPQLGAIRLITEMGILDVRPKEMVLVPRGIKFSVHCIEGNSRGFVCENYGLPFRLPELGPVGSHGLANPEDFQAPCAYFESGPSDYEVVQKYFGALWSTRLPYSPFNVVAWRGRHVPFKYDLSRFVPIGSVKVDHLDPSIFTVLTSPSDSVGGANCDLVVFPPRWTVMQDTFRPPPFHRNVMCEFMGLVHGSHYSRSEGFEPGSCLLHNSWVPHGPDVATHKAATASELKPQPPDDFLSFMFEGRYGLCLTPHAIRTLEPFETTNKAWNGFTSGMPSQDD